ncbi:MAG: TIGR00725 family protein [Candidatus Omnitrophica bacterium CG11_big_fil_rev_8_21_14_0_20_42_13]|uniref:TIGR00725 family protein n=1 Tax=Candidatus Ghiorseimicrobium undicola TaxID=1974746 RepID=A0A2H0LVV1_9BACT|nr:MAG: TIGR00725 family protein [Candidatus Omnitrophica bacterium CG11_big_fil_rev_8_21_14_0_20_42_13]
MAKIIIAVIGGHECSVKVEQIAHKLGKNIAKVGAILACGGLTGVMEAACRGAKEENGTTIGILPSEHKNSANPYVDIPIATGLGFARNAIVTGCADVIVALPGEYGTLSEIGFALNAKKLVIGIGTWDIPGIIKAKDADEAIEQIKKICLTKTR